MEQVAEVFTRAHRKNIQRYRRLLRSKRSFAPTLVP
jgi:hypothetical protein